MPHGHAVAVVFGALTAWHVGWGSFHLARAMIFQRRRFPALRQDAAALESPPAPPPQLYVVITGFGGRAETTARVVQAAVDAAVRVAGPTTFVLCVPEAADQRLVKQAFHHLTPPDRVRLIFVRRPAGCRQAVAAGLRAVVRARPADDAAVMLMTGDTLLPSRAFERSLPFLKAMPEVDLLLTGIRDIAGGGSIGPWLGLDRAERHQMMSSLALARTTDLPDDGPLVFRAELLAGSGLVELVEGAGERPDRLLGACQLIWLELARSGRQMLYLPEVTAVRLVDVWQGPCARTGARIRHRCRMSLVVLRRLSALRSGSAATLIRSCLLQRMVSSLLLLIGLCAAVLLTMVEGAALVWGYLLWLGSLGLLHSLALAGGEARVHGLWPLLAGYSRLIAAACFTQTILVRAIAGRGGSAVPTRRAPAGRRSRWLGSAVQGFLLAILVVVIALIGHLLDLPPLAGPAPGS